MKVDKRATRDCLFITSETPCIGRKITDAGPIYYHEWTRGDWGFGFWIREMKVLVKDVAK